MKVLFVMRHSGYVRNFESTLRMLCERGHHVHLAFQNGTHWLLDPGDMTREMADSYRRFSRGGIPVRDDAWGLAARELRIGLDYLRYLSPEYDNAPKLRERATRDVPEPLLRRMQGPMGSASRARRRVDVVPRCCTGHSARPGDRRVPRGVQPDVLVGDAAHRAGLAAGRVPAQRARARHPHGALRGQLGQPDQQGADSRSGRSGDGVERDDEARGGRAARRARASASW